MPTKLRNIVFIAICICALSIAFIYQGAKWAHVLPASFNNGTYSYLEAAKLQTRPKLALSSIKDGTFQSQTEKWITTKVPKRDSVMLFNAKVQRSVIRTANLAFGFDSVPTFYGSSYSYNSKLEIITEQAGKATNEKKQNLNEASGAINEFQQEHSDLNVTVATPDRTAHSEANPTFSLVSNVVTKQFMHDNFIDKLNSSVQYVDLSIADEEEHSEVFFKTDHHWSIKGARSAYLKIMDEAYTDLNKVRFDELITYEKPAFYGSLARRALMLNVHSDVITDYKVDMHDVQIKINNKQCNQEDIAHAEMYENGAYSSQKLSNRYAEYFHKDVAKIEFHSTNRTGRNLLLIADSFSNPCERFFASSFDNVVVIDQRYNKENLKDLITNNNITDVLLMPNTKFVLEEGGDILTKWPSS